MEFFLKDSMMVMEIVPLFEAKTKPLKRKLQHKTNEIAWKPKSREERHVSRGKRGLPRSRHPPQADRCKPPRSVVATTAKPWCLLSNSTSCFSNAAFWVLPQTAVFALDSPCQINWASFASFLESIWLQLNSSLLALGSLN